MRANGNRNVWVDVMGLCPDDLSDVDGFDGAGDFGCREDSEDSEGVWMIPVKDIRDFPNHPFRLYEGERLEELVCSIKECGVLNPVIVRRMDDGYEMLSGHNRLRAAACAGLKLIPAVVKEQLSAEEAYVYVVETNMLQRSFAELLPTEKAAVVKARYERVPDQARRSDIIREIVRLEGCSVADSAVGQELKTRDDVGRECELSASSVGRLLKINDLIRPFKDMLDRGALHLKVATQLAFLSDDEQRLVFYVACKSHIFITMEMAMRLRGHAGSLTETMVKKDLRAAPSVVRCYRMPKRIMMKYFAGVEPDQVDEIVEQALAAWFGE